MQTDLEKLINDSDMRFKRDLRIFEKRKEVLTMRHKTVDEKYMQLMTLEAKLSVEDP